MSDNNPKPDNPNMGSQFNFYAPVTGAVGHNAVYNANAGEKSSYPSVLAPSDARVKDGGVFVSYSRKDADKFVVPALEKLYKTPLTIWWDQANIPPGANWRDEIEAALKKSKAMILFITQNSLDSSIVNEEYRYFVNNKKRLYPVLCELVMLPAALQGINYVTFEQFDRLIEELLKTES